MQNGNELQGIEEKTQVFPSLTGVRIEEFENLSISFEAAWKEFVAENFLRGNHQRVYGIDRQAELNELAGQLFHALISNANADFDQ
jgi:hypothetical protein